MNAPLEDAGYCHCTRCQRRTGGGAEASARTREGSFRITRGEDEVKFYRPDEGSGDAFCSVCGSGLWSPSPDEQTISLRMGSFDTDPGVPITYRQFVNYAAPWEPIPDDGIPRYPERRPSQPKED